MRQHFYNLWSQHVRKKVIGERKRRIKVNPQEVDGQWLTFPFPFVHHQPHLPISNPYEMRRRRPPTNKDKIDKGRDSK